MAKFEIIETSTNRSLADELNIRKSTSIHTYTPTRAHNNLSNQDIYISPDLLLSSISAFNPPKQPI